MIERGTTWLENYQATQLRKLDNWDKEKDAENRLPKKQSADNLDALVYMVLAEAEKKNQQMCDYLYRDRTKLAVYSLATFGLALHAQGEEEKLAMVMRNLSQYVQQDDENQTAWLKLPSSGWWYWYGSEYEAHAYYLKLLAATEPKSEVAPSRLVKYLLNNRKHATYWNSTRDTALVVEAFADYLASSGEDAPEATIEIWIDGQQRKEVAVTRDNLFSFDNKLVLSGDELVRWTAHGRDPQAGPLADLLQWLSYKLHARKRHSRHRLGTESGAKVLQTRRAGQDQRSRGRSRTNRQSTCGSLPSRTVGELRRAYQR